MVFDKLRLRHTSEGDEEVLGIMQVKGPFCNEAFVHYSGKGTFPLANTYVILRDYITISKCKTSHLTREYF